MADWHTNHTPHCQKYCEACIPNTITMSANTESSMRRRFYGLENTASNSINLLGLEFNRHHFNFQFTEKKKSSVPTEHGTLWLLRIFDSGHRHRGKTNIKISMELMKLNGLGHIIWTGTSTQHTLYGHRPCVSVCVNVVFWSIIIIIIILIGITMHLCWIFMFVYKTVNWE